MTIEQAWEQITKLLQKVYGGYWYWLLFFLSLAFAFFFVKEKRKSLFWPSVLLLVVVLLPPLYVWLWRPTIRYAHWRMYWLFPLLPVVAYGMSAIVSRLWRRRRSIGILSFFGMLLLVMLCGRFVYQGAETSFSEAQNAYKIPETAKEVADYLLTLEEEPRVVAESGMNLFLRQYAAEIRQMYGRNEFGFISGIPGDRRRVAQTLEESEPDLELVATVMQRYEYTYLIKKDFPEEQEARYREAGFEMLRMFGDTAVLRLQGV